MAIKEGGLKTIGVTLTKTEQHVLPSKRESEKISLDFKLRGYLIKGNKEGN